MRQEGHQLDGRFREAIDAFLPVVRIGAARQQSRRDQPLQPVCEEISKLVLKMGAR